MQSDKATNFEDSLWQRHPLGAFTLIELLVVIAIIGLLCALLLPALSHAAQRTQGVYCLNNSKQLMIAMTMYCSEFEDLFPPNPDDGNSMPGHNWCSGNAGRGGAAEFDSDLLTDPKRSLLSPFVRGSVDVFHCPGDKRTGVYQGANPAMKGKIVPAARTFSMNQAVGTICPQFDAGAGHGGRPILPVNGPWLNDDHNHRRDSPWFTYGKLSSIGSPGPAGLWVLIDENAYQLNDAAFAVGMERGIWYDLPGVYHNGGSGLAFADGHSEGRRWLYKSSRQGEGPWPVANAQDRQDWIWIQQRTSANAGGTSPLP